MTRGERGDINARGRLLALQNELWSLIREEAIVPSARSSMLERADRPPGSQPGRFATGESRRVEFRGAGFAPTANRTPAGSRWRW